MRYDDPGPLSHGVNNQPTYRRGEYFRAELALNNQQSPINQSVTNLAVLNNGTNADIISTNIGSAFLAKTPELFSHDADGNLLVDGQWTNTWNGENRLVTVETTAAAVSAGAPRQKVEWSYLPDGRWSQRVVSLWSGGAWVAQSTNRFVWDGVVLLAVLDGNNQVQQAYLRGSDLSGSMAGAGGVGGLLAIKVGPALPCGPLTNTTHFAAYDGNGNVMGLVSADDGTETARYEYSPFGETLRATGPMALVNSLRFSTQFTDDITGTTKYLLRDYQADLGRWLSRDPLDELGGLTLQGFVRNDAINNTDVLGLNPLLKWMAGCALNYLKAWFGPNFDKWVGKKFVCGEVEKQVNYNNDEDEICKGITWNPATKLVDLSDSPYMDALVNCLISAAKSKTLGKLLEKIGDKDKTKLLEKILKMTEDQLKKQIKDLKTTESVTAKCSGGKVKYEYSAETTLTVEGVPFKFSEVLFGGSCFSAAIHNACTACGCGGEK